MEVKEIVGIDFSKDKFDAYCRKCDSYMVFNNTKEGFRQFKKWIQKLLGKQLSDVFIVMEHTGMYTHLFEQYLHKENLSFTKQPGYAIKHSLGIVRGKSDKKDAKRISEYGWDQRTKLQPLPAESKEMIRLKHLISLRDKFVADRAGYLARLPEQQVFLDLSDSDEMVLTQKAMIAAFDKNIKRAETAIQKTIAKDEKMATSYKLLTSIDYFGDIDPPVSGDIDPPCAGIISEHTDPLISE